MSSNYPKETPVRQYFHKQIPPKVTTKDKIKYSSQFTNKFLLWQVMYQLDSVSEPYVHEGCMNSGTYLKKCIIRF